MYDVTLVLFSLMWFGKLMNSGSLGSHGFETWRSRFHFERKLIKIYPESIALVVQKKNSKKVVSQSLSPTNKCMDLAALLDQGASCPQNDADHENEPNLHSLVTQSHTESHYWVPLQPETMYWRLSVWSLDVLPTNSLMLLGILFQLETYIKSIDFTFLCAAKSPREPTPLLLGQSSCDLWCLESLHESIPSRSFHGSDQNHPSRKEQQRDSPTSHIHRVPQRVSESLQGLQRIVMDPVSRTVRILCLKQSIENIEMKPK